MNPYWRHYYDYPPRRYVYSNNDGNELNFTNEQWVLAAGIGVVIMLLLLMAVRK